MSSRRRKRHWLRVAAVAYIVATATLGWIGLMRQFPGLPVVDYALRVFRLFSAYGTEEPDRSERSLNTLLLLARGLAGIVSVVAVAQVVRIALGERWTAFRLRLSRGHVIICGLGSKGRQLAGNLRGEGASVVGIDCDAQTDASAAAWGTGIQVLTGDASDQYLLARANLRRAAALVALSGSDRTNVEIAMLAAASHRPKGQPPLLCGVHLASRRNRELLQQSELFRSSDHCALRFFNVDELSARLLLGTNPTMDITAGRTHLLLIGFGHLGESLALQHAYLAHYPDGARPRITVVAPDAERRKNAFLTLHPYFPEVCETEFVKCDLSATAFGGVEAFRDASASQRALVVVAGEEDIANLFTALELVSAWPKLDAPIYVRMQEAKGLKDLAGAVHVAGKRANFIPFGQLEQVCRREIILGEQLDLLARNVHEHYRRLAFARGESDANNPALVPWESLGEDLREANRRQADHHEIKLRAVGASTVALRKGEEAAFQFQAEEIEALSRAEHARWCAERRLSGWTFGAQRDNARKLHPSLVPWEQLGGAIREYDGDVVRALPELLALVGRKIVRQPGAPEAETETDALA